ncbi:MAG: hypothetical protein EOO40_07515, partial [Deltaproteobacteria bacterium]
DSSAAGAPTGETAAASPPAAAEASPPPSEAGGGEAAGGGEGGAGGAGGASAGGDGGDGEGSESSDDFALMSSERGLRKKLPSLQRRLNVFTEKLRILFSKALRAPVSIELTPPRIVSATKITQMVPSWAAASEMQWTHLGRAGFMGLNHALSFALIELAYGAPPSMLRNFSLTDPRQRLTEVERQTLSPLLGSLCRELGQVMPEHIVGGVQAQAMSPPVQVDPDKTVEAGVHTSFVFQIGETQARVATILFTHVLEHLDDEHPSTSEHTQRMLSQHVGETEVDVMALLGKTHVPLNLVMSLKAGDLLWLDCAQSDHLPVFVEQALKFLAQPISRNGALGVEIVARVP